MTWRWALVAALLAFGVGITLLGTVGLVRGRNVYGRLHFGGPGNFLAPVALAFALAIGLGVDSPITVRAIMIALLLSLTGPIVSHATARAARLRSTETLKVDLAETPGADR